MLKLVRRLTRPISRAMVLVMAWNHREAVARWICTRRLRLVEPDTILVEGEGVGVDVATTALGGSIRHVHAA